MALSVRDFVHDAAALEVSNRTGFAAFVFLVWDIALTFADEIEFIWSQPFKSPTKWAFLIGRYWALFTTFCLQLSGMGRGLGIAFLHPPYCAHYYTFQSISLQIVIMCQQTIFIMRVYALWDRSRRLVWTLGVLFILQHITIAASDGISLRHIVFDDACQTLFTPTTVFGVGAAPLAYDLLLLVLTAIKCAKAIFASRGRMSIMHILMRDGLLAFAAVFVTFAINGLFYLVINGPASATAWTWQLSVCAVAPGRVVLQMHAESRASLRPRPGEPHSLYSTQSTARDEFAMTSFIPMPSVGTEDRP